MGSDASALTPADKAAIEAVSKWISQWATPAGWAADIHNLLGKYSQVSNQLVYYQSQLVSLNVDPVNVNPHGISLMGVEIARSPLAKWMESKPWTIAGKESLKAVAELEGKLAPIRESAGGAMKEALKVGGELRPVKATAGAATTAVKLEEALRPVRESAGGAMKEALKVGGELRPVKATADAAVTVAKLDEKVAALRAQIDENKIEQSDVAQHASGEFQALDYQIQKVEESIAHLEEALG